MSTRRRQTQRQRLSIACDSCRERKRKCDGRRPCNMCVGYGYECSYRSTPRTRRNRQAATRAQAAATQELSPPAYTPSMQLLRPEDVRMEPSQNSHAGEISVPEQGDQPNYLRSVQSNSGAAFVRLLTMTLEDSGQNTSPMRMLAWNLFLGERQSDITPRDETITDILTELQMEDLALVYFKKFHPCYGFVDRTAVFDCKTRVWSDDGNRYPATEAMLCGVAAIGYLFSSDEDPEQEYCLAAHAKHLMDPATAGAPSLHWATAWLLRTVYLRLTAKPEEAWSSSCLTLHVIDAARSMNPLGTDHPAQCQVFQDSNQVWRNIIGVAQHLNIWLSYDLGRRRVVIPSLDAFPLLVRPGEYTGELLGLLPYSEVLDPTKTPGSVHLHKSLVEVLDRVHTEPPSVLAQCNLALCIYRRTLSLGTNVPENVKHKFFTQLQKSIQAVHSALEQYLPWHHVANIPFQILCMLLYIDTAQSFQLLNETLTCIMAVNDTYLTEATRDAATAARALLQLHRKRREAHLQNHTTMLSLYPPLDLRVQETQSGLLSGDALQDSWWFNEFLAEADLPDDDDEEFLLLSRQILEQ